MRLARAFLAVMLGLGAAAAAAEAPVAVTVGAVPSIPAAATYIAIEKGYFRDAGIEVRIENIDSASQAVAVLATNRMQVVEGAFPVGYFNALAKELPVVLALERGSSPLYHNFLVRTDLKDAIKGVADLKGRMVAIVAPGSIIVYETGKVLESAGLTLHDVTVKYIPFTQMAVAFANKAIDAAIMVPPFGDAVVEQGLAVRWLDPDDVIRPQPMAILVYMINTDWAAKNRDLARAYFVAVLRGAREYCQAYHDGPNRAEVVEIMMKHGAVSDRALLDKMPWPARDPDGRFSVDSLVDLQDWFYKEGLATAKFPASRLVDASYAEYAREKLGPFELVNKESRRVGCR